MGHFLGAPGIFRYASCPAGGLPQSGVRVRATQEDYVFHCFSIFEVFLGVSFLRFGICRV